MNIWNQVKSQIVGSILTALIIAAGVAIWQSATTSGLIIRVFSGATEDDLNKVKNQLDTLTALTTSRDHPADYDSNWFALAQSCSTYAKEIGFSQLPRGLMAYYKIGRGGEERIFSWGANQYGDQNQGNGVLLDFDENGTMYVRLPCNNRLGDNALHLGRYRTRDGGGNVDYINRTDVQFRVLLWQ